MSLTGSVAAGKAGCQEVIRRVTWASALRRCP
jgi:hypothetical protein